MAQDLNRIKVVLVEQKKTGKWLAEQLGVSGAALVSSIMKIPLTVKASTVALAIGFSTLIGVVFGVYPARRAAKMPPIEALRRD